MSKEMKDCPDFDSWLGKNECISESDGLCTNDDKPCPYIVAVKPPFSLRQTELKEWQERNFPPSLYDDLNREQLVERIRILELSIGMSEEVGELSHIILKASQKIREGISGKINKDLVADGFADTVIYGTQLLSKLGIDAEEAIQKTIDSVLKRDWANNRKDADKDEKEQILFRKGDRVGFIFGQPGNDTTHLLVMEDEIPDHPIKCYDIWFESEKLMDRNRIWKLSKTELGSSVHHHKYGSTTSIEQFERIAKEKL